MNEHGRLIVDGFKDAYHNMGIDEALLIKLKEKHVPILRLYGWNPSAVSLGYFQRVQDEVDVQAAKEEGIDIVRRITGGGAVYHDRDGEITYSLIMPFWGSRIPKDPVKIYKLVCSALVLSFKNMGFKDAKHEGVNDITIGGRKVSGSALVIKPWGFLQHGTVLLRVDPEKMFRVLKVPQEKIRDKIIKSVIQRVTSLRDKGFSGGRQEVISHLIKGFGRVTGINFIKSIVEEEIKIAEGLVVKKYGSKEWLYRRKTG